MRALIMALRVITTLGDLENASAAKIDEIIIPSTAELDVPLVIAAEGYLDALWTYILDLATTDDEELQTSPLQPRSMGRRPMTMYKFPWVSR